MADPTYDRSKIDANQEWEVAFVLSEIMNDGAPIGWSKYIGPAKCLLAAYEMKRKDKKGEAAPPTGDASGSYSGTGSAYYTGREPR